jgi:hypothetical protein
VGSFTAGVRLAGLLLYLPVSAALVQGGDCMGLLPSPADELHAQRLSVQAEVVAHLLALPGVERASVIIADPPPTLPRFDDPTPAAPRKVSVILVASHPIAASDVQAVVAAAVPGVVPADVFLRLSVATATQPVLRRVGPFEVAPASFAPLAATFATLLVLVAVLGILLFRSERTRQPKLADRR